MIETANQSNKKVSRKISWLSEATYEKAKKEVESWPQWKKDAFEKFYSISNSSRLTTVK